MKVKEGQGCLPALLTLFFNFQPSHSQTGRSVGGRSNTIKQEKDKKKSFPRHINDLNREVYMLMVEMT